MTVVEESKYATNEDYLRSREPPEATSGETSGSAADIGTEAEDSMDWGVIGSSTEVAVPAFAAADGDVVFIASSNMNLRSEMMRRDDIRGNIRRDDDTEVREEYFEALVMDSWGMETQTDGEIELQILRSDCKGTFKVKDVSVAPWYDPTKTDVLVADLQEEVTKKRCDQVGDRVQLTGTRYRGRKGTIGSSQGRSYSGSLGRQVHISGKDVFIKVVLFATETHPDQVVWWVNVNEMRRLVAQPVWAGESIFDKEYGWDSATAAAAAQAVPAADQAKEVAENISEGDQKRATAALASTRPCDRPDAPALKTPESDGESKDPSVKYRPAKSEGEKAATAAEQRAAATAAEKRASSGNATKKQKNGVAQAAGPN